MLIQKVIFLLVIYFIQQISKSGNHSTLKCRNCFFFLLPISFINSYISMNASFSEDNKNFYLRAFRIIHELRKRLWLLLLLLSRFSRVQLCVTPQTAAHRLLCPWDSPGKNTGVGCHFLLQCMKVKSESEVTQSCPTLSDPMDCSPPDSSVHGIFQARVLEWGAIWGTIPSFISRSDRT